PHQQGRAAGPHLVPRPAHRARGGRADRARSPARRACLLSADLFAGRAERGPAEPRGARAHRRLYEARRHPPVRHARPRRSAPGRCDTRDAVEAPAGAGGETRGPGMQALRAILSSLDIPELEPVRRDHVLTKTFYLLKDFPGRFSSGQLWVEALPAVNDDEPASRPARAGDGVSSIIITSNDFAGAWAMRADGQAMLPLVAAEPRQREFAFRAGVNIVMYTLTGNYKADQVHVPALLERLGQ